ncbi:MAG TPA: ABC transporter substrate-binding protein, partial [Rubrobacter sp.]|nr:ABC transporter substrate-binding protein [Rubrobacter sp.]
MGRGRMGGRVLTRQDFLLLSAGASAGLALAGCGGSQSDLESAGSGGKSYNGPKVNLSFWNGFTGGDGPYMQKLVDQFNSEQKKINVSMNTLEWETYYQKVPSAVQSGKGPDLGIMHIDQLPTNAARGVVLALDDVAKALDLKESDFVPIVWQGGLYNGKRYGIPLDVHPLGLYYNRTTMEKGGLDPDNPPQTNDAYMAALEQLKGNGIEGSWVSPFLFTGGLTFQALIYQFGGELYNADATKATFNSEAGVNALSWMVDLVKEGYSPKNVAQDADLVALRNGKNALNWNGIWTINTLKEDKNLQWGAAAVPQIGTQKAVWAGSHQFVQYKQKQQDENKLTAGKVFINWISQQSLEWAKGGQVPARKEVRESAEFKALPEQAAL